MTFGEILQFAKKGQKVRRKNWKNEEFYVYLSKDETYFLNRFKVNSFLELEDYAAVDWEVYKEREYFDWNKALEMMEKGNGVARKAWECTDEGWIYLDSLNNNYFYVWDKDPEVCNGHYLTRADLKAKDWYLV